MLTAKKGKVRKHNMLLNPDWENPPRGGEGGEAYDANSFLNKMSERGKNQTVYRRKKNTTKKDLEDLFVMSSGGKGKKERIWN